jgi:hypothetical protein
MSNGSGTAALDARVRGETFQGHWAQLRDIATLQVRGRDKYVILHACSMFAA